MSGKIIRVEHRHSDQKKDDSNLVLEVGKPLPPFYQAGRRKGIHVKSIEGGDPVICTLDDGDLILIGERSVRDVTREKPNT